MRPDDPRLTGYVLESLSPEEKAMVERAMLRDEEIAREVDALRGMSALLGAAGPAPKPMPGLSDDQWAKIEAAASGVIAAKKPRWTEWSVIAAMAAMVTLVLVLWSVRPGREPAAKLAVVDSSGEILEKEAATGSGAEVASARVFSAPQNAGQPTLDTLPEKPENSPAVSRQDFTKDNVVVHTPKLPVNTAAAAAASRGSIIVSPTLSGGGAAVTSGGTSSATTVTVQRYFEPKTPTQIELGPILTNTQTAESSASRSLIVTGSAKRPTISLPRVSPSVVASATSGGDHTSGTLDPQVAVVDATVGEEQDAALANHSGMDEEEVASASSDHAAGRLAATNVAGVGSKQSGNAKPKTPAAAVPQAEVAAASVVVDGKNQVGLFSQLSSEIQKGVTLSQLEQSFLRMNPSFSSSQVQVGTFLADPSQQVLLSSVPMSLAPLGIFNVADAIVTGAVPLAVPPAPTPNVRTSGAE